jgi:hypothetical protein
MNKEFVSYIDKVIDSIGVTGRKERQIREDLYTSLTEKQQATGETNPYYLMGEVEEVAAEFRENLEITEQAPDKFSYGYRHWYEYKSKTKVFGIPLVHINTRPMGVAKGIFAFGTIAVGAVSCGGLSIGILSLGGLSIGLLLSLGGAAISGGLSIGGAAIAYGASMGGAAIAQHIAFGGYANANIAVGGVTEGVISIFNQSGTGDYLFRMPVNENEVIEVIKEVYPRIGKGILSIIRGLL